jgi:hypothetical protein
MKKLSALILTIFLGFNAWAQTMVKEAFVQYEMTEVSSSDPQTESMLQMMKGSTIDIYFNEKQQRTDIDMMGGMMKMQTFTGLDGEAPNAMYMDMMGRKLKIPMTDAEMEQYQQKEDGNAKPTIEEVSGEGKTILGFKCKKIKMSMEGQEFNLIAYVTDQISSPKSVLQNTNTDVDLGGFPLEYTIEHSQMSMTYSAKQFKKELDSNTMSPPAGYEEMSFEDFMSTMGAMGGMGQ